MPKKNPPSNKPASAKPSKAQTDAEKRSTQFIADVKKTLGVKAQPMREIAAKLGLTDETGAVKPSNAAKIRAALGKLIDSGDAVRSGESTRNTVYAKVRKAK